MKKELLEKYRSEIGDYESGDFTRLELLKSAHKILKDNFTYLSDEENYGSELNIEQNVYDIWRIKTDNIKTVEDCDGFALKLLFILSEICRIPKKYLYFTTGLAFTGEGHAMPCLRDEKGVLWQADNMLDAPIPAYYIYNSLGGSVRPGIIGDIFRLDNKKNYEYKTEYIKEPEVRVVKKKRKK